MNVLLTTLYHFAATYGCGSYGGGTYNNGSCSAASGNGSVLTNTGFVVAAVITAACILIFVTLLVRISRKKKK